VASNALGHSNAISSVYHLYSNLSLKITISLKQNIGQDILEWPVFIYLSSYFQSVSERNVTKFLDKSVTKVKIQSRYTALVMIAGLRTERERLMLGFHAGTRDFSFFESSQTVSGIPSLVFKLVAEHKDEC